MKVEDEKRGTETSPKKTLQRTRGRTHVEAHMRAYRDINPPMYPPFSVLPRHQHVFLYFVCLQAATKGSMIEFDHFTEIRWYFKHRPGWKCHRRYSEQQMQRKYIDTGQRPNFHAERQIHKFTNIERTKGWDTRKTTNEQTEC